MTGQQPGAGVIRIATFHASTGALAGLLRAAADNAQEARSAPGCLSAEVCHARDETVLVISRWESNAPLQQFLSWHQGRAHGSVAPFTTAAPRAMHYAVDNP